MHLAQVNIAAIRHAAIDAPEMKSFTSRVEAINALARRSPGFVWTLEGEDGVGATRVEVFADNPNIIIQLSKWESVESLFGFVYKTAHSKLIAAKADWFVPVPGMVNMALWWVEDDHLPTIAEAKAAMVRLHRDGPTPAAFGFDAPFAADGTPIATRWPRKDCA